MGLISVAQLTRSGIHPNGESDRMDLDKEIVSDITVFGKYARYMPNLERRETWAEIVHRNKDMHVRKFQHLYDNNEDFRNTMDDAFQAVEDKAILPSMRSMQFGGVAIEKSHSRMYNCAFLPIDSFTAFSEAMFLLLGGTGVGYSVQKANVSKLPTKLPDKGNEAKVIIVDDSKEGWADAVRDCVKSIMEGEKISFDYSEIRPKGAPLVTSGGKAPGPEPLIECIDKITNLLENNVEVGERMTPLNAHDIMCHLASAVLSGGIRRSAMISLFDKDDDEMIQCKSGNWYETHPDRATANNSVVFDRATTTKKEFEEIWSKTEAQRYGEPGFYFTNDVTWGTNPCCEIALRPFQFCNLTEINASESTDEWPMQRRVELATFLGTLQASYTDFDYLRPIWKTTTEKDALLGVSMTGVASGEILEHDLNSYTEVVKSLNKKWANLIGINPAARTTCVKPAGTSSLVLGTSSGVHAWHNDYYIRRQRINKDESLYQYLKVMHPELVQECTQQSEIEKGLALISTPVRAPKGAIVRTETALDFLERVRRFSTDWVRPGHIDGVNTHNVSATVSIRDNEWNTVGAWLWDNRNVYNGISVLNYDLGGYEELLPPHSDCSEAEYTRLLSKLVEVDLTNVVETEDLTDLQGEIACAGGMCEVDPLAHSTIELEL
jgi:ribonucleoside-diphosphate reductase alpha chain